ncbi:MAG: M20 family peptidase [Dehalococcoidia bacterium]|jgi:carboxypeptidase PM20D1
MKTWVIVILCILAVIVILGGIIAFRTMTFSSKQLPAGDKVTYNIDKNQAAQRLSESIKFKTIFNEDISKVDYEPFAKLQEYLKQTYPLVHSTTELKIINDYGLLYMWEGSDPQKKPILLLAHQDVVPALDEGWTYPPFSGTIADGYIWGRGTLDDKCTLLGMLEAMEYLIKDGFQPTRSIYLASGFDEEITGQQGAGKIAQYFKDNGQDFELITDEGFVVISGAVPGIKVPVALIGLAEKGYLNLELAAESEGGHASMPPRQTTAGIIAAAVDKLEKNPFPGNLAGPASWMFDYLGPEMSPLYKTIFANMWLLGPVIESQLAASPATDATLRTTTAPTMLKGSDRANVLPTRSSAIVNFRLLPGDTIESVTNRVIKVIDDPRVTVAQYGQSANEASPVSSTDSRAFEIYSQTIHEIFPEAVIAPALANSASDVTHYIGLSPNILRFLPQRLTSEDLAMIHGINERISVDNYGEMIDFYIQLIKNYCQ